MSERYIRSHFADIKGYASVIERRLDDSYCTMESVLEDNRTYWELCQKYNVNYLLIEDEYDVDLNL
jgi:hypothetical protein